MNAAYNPIQLHTNETLDYYKMLPAFKFWLMQEPTNRGKARKIQTAEVHIRNLKRLLGHVPKLDLEEVINHLLSLRETGRKATYINQYIDLLRLFGRFIGTESYAANLRYFPEEEHVKATMSDDEIRLFLELPPETVTRYYKSGKTVKVQYVPHEYRIWTLFFKILAYSGMRPGELAHLKTDSVDFGRGVFLPNGKTGPRPVPIAPALIDDLKSHIATLEGEYLFPSHSGKKSERQRAAIVDETDWGYNFHKRLKRLGIKRQNLTVYSLRHSFITRMLEEDVSLPKVQKIVGHSRVDTTMHYTHMTTKDIIKAIKQDPLGRKYLSAYEVMKHVTATIKILMESTDERFKYHLEENEGEIHFSLTIKPPENDLESASMT